MTTYTIVTCSPLGCSPSILAPGRAAIFVSSPFCRLTTAANTDASEGTTSTTSDSQMITIAAGITIRFVSRKHVENRPK